MPKSISLALKHTPLVCVLPQICNVWIIYYYFGRVPAKIRNNRVLKAYSRHRGQMIPRMPSAAGSPELRGATSVIIVLFQNRAFLAKGEHQIWLWCARRRKARRLTLPNMEAFMCWSIFFWPKRGGKHLKASSAERRI